MNSTRTRLARSSHGGQLISKQELYRIRRLQNISGPGVAVSSRGITVSQPKQRRAIPQAVPATGYNGPWACTLNADNTVTIGNGTIANFISWGTSEGSVDPLVYDINNEYTGDPNTSLLQLQVRVRLYYAPNVTARWYVGAAKAGCFTNISNRVPPLEQPNEVAAVFHIPVCNLRLAFPSSSRTIQSIEQLQYGCAFVTMKNTRLRYQKSNDGGMLFVRHVQNFIGSNNVGEHEIHIPKNSGALSIYQDATQATNSLTTSSPPASNSPIYLVAQVSTDQNGDIVSLIDWNAYQPYSRSHLEDTIITDVHNSLP